MKAFLMATQQQNSFTKGLFAILESRYEGFNMQTASSNNEMASMLKNGIYDLAIVNSDEDAVALSTEIVASGLAMPILVYTETNSISLIKKLYDVGVSGVINTAAADDELLKAVEDILAKRIYMSECLKQELLQLSITTMDDYENISYLQHPFYFKDVYHNDMPIIFGTESNHLFTICLN